MKRVAEISLTVAVLLAVNCATYKRLKPKPEPVSQEQGYIELKKGEKNFFLKKEKKYCIAFPRPEYEHFYLVLTSPDMKKIGRSFTADLDKKKTPEPLIPDETYDPDTMSVYPVGRQAGSYFWLIDRVPENMELALRYRYVPKWRFKFEHRYVSYRETLSANRVDRTIYNSIGNPLHPDGESLNYLLIIDSVSRHSGELKKLHQELLDLERIFPANVVNSSDVAYTNYLKLKEELDGEMEFQANYLTALGFFYREFQSRGNAYNFLGDVEEFITYFSQKQALPDRIVTESQSYLERRLSETQRFYDTRLTEKDDIVPFDTAYYRTGALHRLEPLYTAMGIPMPDDLAAVVRFVDGFDSRSVLVGALRDTLDAIATTVADAPNLPGNDLFRSVNARMEVVSAAVPAAIGESFGRYRGIVGAQKLNQEIGRLNTDLLGIAAQYREAGALVERLNVMQEARDFSGMIGLLKRNLHLGFLVDKYSDLDRLSLEEQSKKIRASLTENEWAVAEQGLRALHADDNFLDPASIPRKVSVVRACEDTLYDQVERATRRQVDMFLTEHVGTYENIDSLYEDPVFLPVYDITFTSGGRSGLVERKNKLVADLQRMKESEFPAKAVRLLFDEFIKTPDDNGVLKARAIMAHGDRYKGDEREVKLRISEVNPMLAKWITKPTEYRRVFVVPVTDNRSGKNKYVVRFNIRVKSDARFPVYDVNIKLPKEVARNAGTKQWFDKITLNRKELKNEGRFTITAPMAQNGYECQITPVSMDKDKNNVLEISFHHAAFKVLQVSVMVQKPIIKKN